VLAAALRLAAGTCTSASASGERAWRGAHSITTVYWFRSV
jgi:hypothetical protein